jgi:hypothetical protein
MDSIHTRIEGLFVYRSTIQLLEQPPRSIRERFGPSKLHARQVILGVLGGKFAGCSFIWL